VNVPDDKDFAGSGLDLISLDILLGRSWSFERFTIFIGSHANRQNVF
jgi:hypothetical protein